MRLDSESERSRASMHAHPHAEGGSTFGNFFLGCAMCEHVQDVLDRQARAFHDGFPRHHLGVERDAFSGLLVVCGSKRLFRNGTELFAGNWLLRAKSAFLLSEHLPRYASPIRYRGPRHGEPTARPQRRCATRCTVQRCWACGVGMTGGSYRPEDEAGRAASATMDRAAAASTNPRERFPGPS